MAALGLGAGGNLASVHRHLEVPGTGVRRLDQKCHRFSHHSAGHRTHFDRVHVINLRRKKIQLVFSGQSEENWV